MITEKQALELIKELTEEVGENADPLWAWMTVHDLACHALGLCEVPPEGIQWALAKVKELGLIE